MRFLFLAVVALTIAIAGGAWSASVMLERFEGAGSLDVGPWQADRLAGSPAADPYSKARLARDGNLTLGLAEGMAFRAVADSERRALRRECTYRIAGALPPARVWTLSAFDGAGRPILERDRPAWLTSENLMRDDANEAPVLVGARPQPGNWLAVSGTGGFVLALTLYDTPASTAGGATDVSMPSIERTGCAVDG
jgi:hypothetical protein